MLSADGFFRNVIFVFPNHLTMNFLAHLLLAGNNKYSIIGNFIADHVKGSTIDLYNEEIKAGIRFHRMIDEFTDAHEVVKEAVVTLRPDFHKYAGVVVDMYYDHFLAKDWKKYNNNEPLEEFTARVFEVLHSSYDILPQRSRYILPYMMADNWLLNYRNFDGLHQALTGISKRTTFESGLENAVEYLKNHYHLYQQSFNEFFPQLLELRKY